MAKAEPPTFHLIFSYYTPINAIFFSMSMAIHYTTCMKRDGAGCFQIRNSAFSSIKACVFP